jgi:hypothetical protein
MQKFTQGFLPLSFEDTWVSNRIRRADQNQIELRNSDDLNIPFARLSSTLRHPLCSFPKLWESFENEQIKFTRNTVEFNKLLKAHFLTSLNVTPICNRLLCPECHLKNITNISRNQNVDGFDHV